MGPRALLLAVAALLLAPAALAPGDTELLPYGSKWLYRIVPTQGSPLPPAVDAALPYGDYGPAPFGSLPPECNFLAPPTVWPPNTELLAANVFVVPPGATNVRFGIRIDNDIAISIDGTPYLGRTHTDECAVPDELVVPAPPLLPGPHHFQVHAWDTGGATWFDPRVIATT